MDAFDRQALLKRADVGWGYAVSSFQWDIAETVLSSVLYGVFIVLALAAFSTLIYQGPRKTVNLLLAVVLLCLFSSTTLHFATNVLGQHVSALMDAMTAFSTDAEMMAHADYLRYYWNVATCGQTVALTINILLGDAIVWWRACVLWRANWAIRLACVAFLIATGAFGAVVTARSCYSQHAWTPVGWSEGDGYMYEGVSYGIAATALSLATNVVTTSLVGYKLWEHRHILEKYIVIGSRVSRMEKVLCLLVESGVVYGLLWIVVVVWQVRSDTGSPVDVTSPWTFYNVFSIVIDGGLVPIIAIYPTLIIVLVALGRSEFDNSVRAQRATTIDTPQARPQSSLFSEGQTPLTTARSSLTQSAILWWGSEKRASASST